MALQIRYQRGLGGVVCCDEGNGKWWWSGLDQRVYRLKSSWMMLASQDASVSKLENQPVKNYDQNDFIIPLHM